MDTEYIHPTWPVDQLVNWYEAPVVGVLDAGGLRAGARAADASRQAVRGAVRAADDLSRAAELCVTGRGLPFITRIRGTNTIIVRGGVPARSGATEVFVTVENPIQYFATVTHETFVRNGINVQGQIIVTPRDDAARLAAGVAARDAAQHPRLRHQQEEPEPLRRAGGEDHRRGDRRRKGRGPRARAR